ncbi:ABC transporter substrate-binding protein [Demequina mangrovi]|uniref:Amino acid ABC transporter substrate-binding protein, PAAT family n=1 Tax=Demequina mangrovi TaxID=1043493 RepID=A0A1H6ZA95_9MICO|nr:ABC transporter substrate-binding protein [Demequina mangrovi]SEJ45795.1 amino acid ABC transporter substrate-binding protein, PAAT family [Demequina mangrovi]
MRTPALVAIAATAALALTGCTYASQEPTGTTGSTAGTAEEAFNASTVAVNEDAAALLPADIAERGTLRVGMETSYAPAEFLDVDGQTPIGYDVEIATALAASLGLEVAIESAAFDGIIPGIGTKYDAGISSFTVTPERVEVADMTSYLSVGEAFAVAAGNPAGIDADDLCGATVALQTGTIQQDEANQMAADCEAAGKDALEILTYDSNADAATNVVGGKADVLFADSPIIGYAVTQTGDKLEQLGESFATAPQGIVTAQGSEVTDAIALALQGLMDDGTLKSILDAWGAADGMLTTAEVNPA